MSTGKMKKIQKTEVNSNDGALVDHLEVSCKGDDRAMRGKYYIKVQKITSS